MSKYTGQVKWFNNKIGYGFITVLKNNSNETPKDVFVHHMNICPIESNYRTLKLGEYVEFELDTHCEGPHSEQAVKVTGIMGHELQCDFIHRLNKKKKTNRSKKDDEDNEEDNLEEGAQ